MLKRKMVALRVWINVFVPDEELRVTRVHGLKLIPQQIFEVLFRLDDRSSKHRDEGNEVVINDWEFMAEIV